MREKWSPALAYVVGLITTDGSLSIDKRHIVFTSNDYQLIFTFAKLLNLKNKIGLKRSSFTGKKQCYQIQFGDVAFYRFLESIGLTHNKTKRVGLLKIPNRFFADFIRGHLDGDGYTYSYWDYRWKNSFMLYTGFISASRKHVMWIRDKIKELYKVEGALTQQRAVFRLLYAKRASVILIKKMYHKPNIPCLIRKKFKIKKALGIIRNQAGMLKLADRHA